MLHALICDFGTLSGLGAFFRLGCGDGRRCFRFCLDTRCHDIFDRIAFHQGTGRVFVHGKTVTGEAIEVSKQWLVVGIAQQYRFQLCLQVIRQGWQGNVPKLLKALEVSKGGHKLGLWGFNGWGQRLQRFTARDFRHTARKKDILSLEYPILLEIQNFNS